jgi:histidine triad (HIT) family protein
MQDCIFCKIVGGQIPADVVYRDEHVTAFRDIEPQAPVHVLLVPNEHVTSVRDLEAGHEAAMGRLLRAAGDVGRQVGVDEGGYRLTINTGRDAVQVVQHLHLHLMGGRKFSWPPG